MRILKVVLRMHLVVFLLLVLIFSLADNAHAKKWRLRSAGVMSIEAPYTVGMNKLCELVKERSGGDILIKHHPAGQLGKGTAIIEGVKLGTIDMAATGPLGSRVLSGLVSPFLFKDHQHLDRVFASPVWEKIKKLYLEETGIVIVGGAYFAPRMLTTKKKKVVSPSDCKGLKIRVPPAPVLVSTWKALGASPTPIAFAELFTALQQGTVDAQENPYQVIWDQSFYEVQKYISPISYIIPPRLLIINADLWKNLGPEKRKLIEESWAEAAKLIQSIYLEKEAWYEQKLKEKGMIFVEPDIAAFRKATENVWQEFAPKTLGEGVYEEIQKLRN